MPRPCRYCVDGAPESFEVNDQNVCAACNGTQIHPANDYLTTCEMCEREMRMDDDPNVSDICDPCARTLPVDDGWGDAPTMREGFDP